MKPEAAALQENRVDDTESELSKAVEENETHWSSQETPR